MYGKADRELLQAIYAKLFSIDSKLDKLLEEKKTDIEDSSPFLNSDGLYSFKDYKAKARELANKKKGIE